MLPRFKYLSERLFSSKSSDSSKHSRARDRSKASNARNHALPGELFTTTQTSIVESEVKHVVSTSGVAGGFFTGASNFTLNNPTFIDGSQTTNYFIVGFPVLMTLKDAGTPEAALDSAVRYPPPKCHPGSRQTVNGRLEQWLLDLYRQRKMTWLYGPAGVGKSAVAQTFGELARERGCLGAAFFSAFNDLPTDSFRIIPTLAYQLAIRNPSYKQNVTQQLAGDPSILDATLAVQFQKLIIEPFSYLTSSEIQQAGKMHSYVVILDGLDECDDENAQCELIELINSAAQRSDLPLIWLLCSRPESHIKYTFSQLEFVPSCDREELLIDDETRADVERFMRDGFKEIHKRYRFIIVVGPWPSEDAFDKISKSVSGYFVFASVVMRVVGDRNVGDPEGQLSALLRMLQGLDDVGMNNPLEALDIFYSRILSRVPERVLSTAIQILGICARGEPERFIVSAEEFRLYIFIEKAAFYRSLDKLHSVVRVPSPEDAQTERLSFYHKSFADYLRRQRRSGRFFFSDARTKILLGISALRWYNHIIISRNPDFTKPEEYNLSTAMLEKWSPGRTEETVRRLSAAAMRYFDDSVGEAAQSDTDFFDSLCDFNFGLLTEVADSVFISPLLQFMHVWDWSQTPAGPHFIRTDVFDQTADHKLLHHLSTLTSGKKILPINIHEPVEYSRGKPLPWKGLQPNAIGYVIIGRGPKSGLVCCHRAGKGGLRMVILNTFTPPTTAQISRCCKWIEDIEEQEPERNYSTLIQTPDIECHNQ